MRVGRLLAYQGSYISHAPEAYGRVPPWQCRSAGARYGTLAAGWNRHGLWFCWKNIARHEGGKQPRPTARTAGLRSLEAMSTSATIARRRFIPTTPAATAVVRSVTATKPDVGSPSNSNGCLPVPIT